MYELMGIGYDKTVRVWNVFTGQYIRSLTGHSSIIRSLAAIPPNMSLASASWDNTIRIWNMRSGALLATLVGHTNRVKAVVYHELTPQGGYLLSGSDDCTMKLWDTETYMEVRTYSSHSQPVLCVAVTAKKEHLIFASGSADHSVQLFALEEDKGGGSGDCSSSYLTLGGHQGPVTAVVFSTDSDGDSEKANLFSCSEDMSIILWDCVSGYVLHQLLGHTGPCQSLSIFSQHSTDFLITTRTEYLVSTSLDGSVRVWNTTLCVEENKLDFSGGYLFNAVVAGGAVEGGGDSDKAVKDSVLAISGDDGCLQVYPSFVENYLPKNVRAGGGTVGKRGHQSGGRGGKTGRLPSIGRGGKTLAVRLPTKYLLEDDSSNNIIHNNQNINNSSNKSNLPIGVHSAGLPLPGNNATGAHLESLPPRVEDGLEAETVTQELSSQSGGGTVEQAAGNLPHAPSHSQNSSQMAIRSNASSHYTRLRSVHTKASRPARHNSHILATSSSSARGSGTRRGGKKPGGLPALQHKKEFICVTSQYEQPPASGVVGMLNCNSVTFM